MEIDDVEKWSEWTHRSIEALKKKRGNGGDVSWSPAAALVLITEIYKPIF